MSDDSNEPIVVIDNWNSNEVKSSKLLHDLFSRLIDFDANHISLH